MRITRTSVAALVGAAAVVAGGGTALAAGAGDRDDRQARCQERLARVAERRGLTVAELEAQVKARLLVRVDAAERSGRIGSERAAALRQRIESGSLCPARAHPPVRRAARSLLAAAAGFLGLTSEELREQLPGTSLAALAEKQGKSVADLEAAMLAPAQERLAQAVASGRIAQLEADRRLERLERLVERLVQKVFPAG
jgi:hypothetical protein